VEVVEGIPDVVVEELDPHPARPPPASRTAAVVTPATRFLTMITF
jgi:hypothetical protein